MKLFAILGLGLLAFTATVDAGFCDSKSRSGYYCDGRESKYCSCKKKKSKMSCSKESERDCPYRCGGGRCLPPPTPPPADKVCAKTSVSEPKYLMRCPVLRTPYKLWKNLKDDPKLMAFSYNLTNEDIEWWQILRVMMVNHNYTNITKLADVLKWAPTSYAAWTPTCNADDIEFTCRRTFPECKDNKGVTEKCETACEKLDACAAAMYDGCKTDQKTNANLTCYSYKDLFGEFLDENGKRKCKMFCDEYQNDKDMSSASSLAPSTVLLVLVAAALKSLF